MPIRRLQHLPQWRFLDELDTGGEPVTQSEAGLFPIKVFTSWLSVTRACSPPSLAPHQCKNHQLVYLFLYIFEFYRITHYGIYKETLDLHQLPAPTDWVA